MNQGELFILIALAVVYAPLVAAMGVWRGRQGAGVWKFLTFCCCTGAIFAAFSIALPAGIILWVLAWVFAGVAVSSANRLTVENATLRAIQEQNKLLREQHEKQAPAVKPDLQDEVDGIRYKLNADSSVTAMTPAGLQTYTSWASFRRATNR